MDNFTFLSKVLVFCILILCLEVGVYSQTPINLQCPDDVEVGPLNGECGLFLDFNSLIWTADVPLASSIFTPGPSYFFPPGITSVTLSVADSLGNVDVCSFNVTLHPPTSNLICNNLVTIEFDNDCTRTLTAFDFLEGGPYGCDDFYNVEILSSSGAPLGKTVDTSFLNITYTVKVTDIGTGQTCWGMMLVEPSGIPQNMNCPVDTTVFCHEPTDSINFPTIEGCFDATDYTHTFFDIKTNSFCDGDNIAFTIERQWTSTDPFGNTTNCTQLISGKRVEFSDLEFPKNFDGIELPKLACNNMPVLLLDADTSITGIPLVNGYDPRGLVCNLAFIVSDSVENTCGNNFIIKRKWEAFDYCLDEFFTHTQTIIIADEKGPEFSLPDTILFSTDDNCSGLVRLPRINLIEECSNYEIFIETPWNTFTTDSVFAPVATIPGNYKAIYTATDECGNISKDSIILHVTNGPAALCLEDKSITADYYLENLQPALDSGNYSVLDIYGLPTFFDNCTNTLFQNVQLNLDACLEGHILREHSINFNGDQIICAQKINVHHVSDFVVKFPEDITYECTNEPAGFGEPQIFFETCELIAVNYIDEIFTDVADECYKINRQWSVINWCVVGEELDQEVVEFSELEISNSGCLPITDMTSPCDFDGDLNCDNRTFKDSWTDCHLPTAEEATSTNGPDTDPDSDPWDGYITYLQIIKVNDTIDPVFVNGCDPQEVCIDSNSCDIDLLIPMPEVDDCGGNVTVDASIRVGSIWKDGEGPHVGIEPGEYMVRYVAVDNCNNQTACESTITIKDCTPPVANCKTGIVVNLSNPAPPLNLEMAQITASELNANSFDNCSGQLKFSFSPNENDNTRNYFCEDLGYYILDLWVTDAVGNQSSCELNVAVEYSGSCHGGDLLAGQVSTENGEGIEGVSVEVSYAGGFSTSEDGEYALSIIGANYPFYIFPEKNDDYLNGVTTFDIVLLVKHILGVEILDSPYKIISADINRSNTVTTFDAVEMRKLILGINTKFPNNSSWRFVPSEFEFDDLNNPFGQPIPDTLWVNGPNIFSVDFIGMKIGDLNVSATPNISIGQDDRSSEELIFIKSENLHLNKNEKIELSFYFEDINLIGFQSELIFDLNKIELIEIKDGILKENNFGTDDLEKGQLKISFNQSDGIISNQNEPLFTLIVKSRIEGEVKDVFKINQRTFKAEAYTEDLIIHPMEVFFENEIVEKKKFQIFSAQPNPFRNKTIIPVYMPEAGNVEITISSANGKLLKYYYVDLPKGNSNFEIDKTVLSDNGIVFCKINSAYGNGVVRLMVLD